MILLRDRWYLKAECCWRCTYNLRSQKSLKDDALLSEMVMCKEGQGKGADPFVCTGTSAPKPMSVLCTNSQLFNIRRFCTDDCTSYSLSIDLTFELAILVLQ